MALAIIREKTQCQEPNEGDFKERKKMRGKLQSQVIIRHIKVKGKTR